MLSVSTDLKTDMGTAPGVKQITAFATITPPASLSITPFTAHIASGSVTQDVAGAVTRTATIEITSFAGLEYDVIEIGFDQTFGSDDFGDGYFGGYEARAIRGLFMPLLTTFTLTETFTLQDDTTEDVLQGTFYVTDMTFNDSNGGRTLSVSGMDAAGMLSKSRLVEPYQITAGTNLGTAIDDWITHHMAAATVNVGTTARTSTGAMYLVSDNVDPITVVTQLAALAGWVMWVGRDGEFYVDETPDEDLYTGTPTAVYAFTPANVSAYKLVPSGANLINTVIVTGNSGDSSVPVIGDATLAGSHPYSVASVGQNLVFSQSDDLMKDTTAATAMADTVLRKKSALVETLEVVSVVQVPHVDVRDVVSCSSPNLDLEEPLWTVQGVTYNLGVGCPTFRLARALV